jgi:GNAT superfamily N-acetyltransferase
VDKITFKIANSEDINVISELVNSAFRGESSRRGWTTEADLLDDQRTNPETLRAVIASPNDAILLFFQKLGNQPELIGCLALTMKRDTALLGMLTVRPDLQARGLGRNFLEIAENWVCESWGLGKIEMTVIHKRPELLAWYERRGYLPTGRREPFQPATNPGAFNPELEFLVLEKNLELHPHAE